VIGDDLRAVVDPQSAVGRVLQAAEWVHVPFPVYPYMRDDDPTSGRDFVMNWQTDRVPERLVPADDDGSVTIDRLAFPVMGVFHEREPGALLAVEHWASTEAEVQRLAARMMGSTPKTPWADFYPGFGLLDGFLQVYLIGISPENARLVNVQTFRYMIMRQGTAPRGDQYALRYILPMLLPLFDDTVGDDLVWKVLYLAVADGLTATCAAIGAGPAPTLTEARFNAILTKNGGLHAVRGEIRLDTMHTAVTACTVAALLNARNLPREIVTPTQSRPSRRRGEPPPFRYHVLKIDPAAARTTGSGAGGSHEGGVALHLKRGHWKLYTPGAPLLGKHVGRWWWGAHLAGTADRVVEKDYEITPEDP
jgi:hypothetical protein